MTLAEEIYEDLLYIFHHKEVEEKRQGRSLTPKMFFSKVSSGKMQSGRWVSDRDKARYRIAFCIDAGNETRLSDGSRTVMKSEEVTLNSNGSIVVNQRYVKDYFLKLEKCLTIPKEDLDPDFIQCFLMEIQETPL